jgi:hypothetical protein
MCYSQQYTTGVDWHRPQSFACFHLVRASSIRTHASRCCTFQLLKRDCHSSREAFGQRRQLSTKLKHAKWFAHNKEPVLPRSTGLSLRATRMAPPAGQEEMLVAAEAFGPEKLAAIQQLSVDPVSSAAGGVASLHGSNCPRSAQMLVHGLALQKMTQGLTDSCCHTFHCLFKYQEAISESTLPAVVLASSPMLGSCCWWMTCCGLSPYPGAGALSSRQLNRSGKSNGT